MMDEERSRKRLGLLTGIRIIVLNDDLAKELFSEGFYGKPFGIHKPKPEEARAPLELSLIEALYLMEKGLLRISNGEREISIDELRRYAESIIPKFNLLYIVYKDLRDKGFVVRSGMKFGCDFAVYEFGPGIDHAPYLIHVLSINDELTPLEIVRAGRLSHSVRKRFILAIVDGERGQVKYVMFKWRKP